MEPTTGGGTTRREWLASAGAGAAALCFGRMSRARDGFPIPADKGFTPEWLRALSARGAPSVLRGADLRWVGMPVGGIGCGQLYLGGDGALWLWDVFNQPQDAGGTCAGSHYAKPLEPRSPLAFGFALHVERAGGGAVLPLSRAGFEEVEFRDTYPIGKVTYRSDSPALEVELEAFSPFVPLELEDSSLPATVLSFRVRNLGAEPLRVTLRATLENAVGRWSDPYLRELVRTTRTLRTPSASMIVHGAELPGVASARPDIPFEDFEKETYEGWTVAGTAFGAGPVEAAKLPDYQGKVGADGLRLANSHHTRAGEDVIAGDAHTGELLSREFTIERDWINFLLGGGAHPAQTCVELLVEGEVTATATGANENRLRPRSFYVGGMQGSRARLRIADRATGTWGNVGVDSIVFSDRPRVAPLEARGDAGTLALAALGAPEVIELSTPVKPQEEDPDAPVARDPGRGFVARTLALAARGAQGSEAAATFVLAWHFPTPWRESFSFLPGIEKLRRHYAARFADAAAVASYVIENHERLGGATRLWRDTWYEGSLPGWFLERTVANLSTLATATVHRFDDGRFYAWEGCYSCPGTCTHVWHYAQGPARLFPALERDQRERVDLGLAFHADTGQIDYRAEAARELAVDGQAGTILRVYREHTMSADGAFLARVWPRVKQAVELLLARDPDHDGILDGAQYNTLDTAWYGAIPWLSSLYLAALRAGEAMAGEMGDAEFAARCRAVREAGARSIVARLFDGEHFVQRLDPEHPEANAVGAGCHIDQVLGQAWAHQVGLGRILPEKETRSALSALWKYNFAPDVGPYREYMKTRVPGGRWYAFPGEAGLVMCTWPKGGHESAAGKGSDAWAAGYFNECMTGFEHMAAAHMIAEGLVTEGLAVERAIHERYAPAKRNPFDEIECGDHYARAMASYGVFLAACGFEIHGPKGHIGFAPRLTPADFRAAFVAPEGWGSYAQKLEGGAQSHRIELCSGRLRLCTLRFEIQPGVHASEPRLALGERALAAQATKDGSAVLLTLAEELVLRAGETLAVVFKAW